MSLLLEALRALRSAAPSLRDGLRVSAFHPHFGICGNVANYLDSEEVDQSEFRDVLLARNRLIRDWPDRNRWPTCFPVGGLHEYETKSQLWHNPRRLALLDWMIAQLEKEGCNEF